jgi:starch-binding outer membrane protein, SusD/RagB family
MKSNKIFYILFLSCAVGMLFSSCKKNLERTPLDQISDPEFWKTSSDLELYVNNLYSQLPGWNLSGAGGTPLPDASTDVAIAAGLFLPTKDPMDGAINVPASGGGWNWANVRNVNYFLDNKDRVPAGGLKNQYVGEAYFFRAWSYFTLLKLFGDLPIITKTLDPSDVDILYSTRASRTEVVNFMIRDLDSAIAKMGKKTDLPANRINRDIALGFKARVCLYEGTWEKYHQNDAFKGATDGSGFLDQAAKAAKALIDGGSYSIVTGNPNQVYYELFNQLDYRQNAEVLLFRSYNQEAFGGNFGNQVWNWPNGSGITNEMLRMYLSSDGLPISVSPLYKGDLDIRLLIQNRDPRLVQTVMNPGDPITITTKNDTTKFVTPTLTAQQYCPTGYESQKYRRPQIDPVTGAYSNNMAYIIMRFAEALLIYAEARAELGQLTQADVDLTINRLRSRVGMPRLVLGSITADPAWPGYGYVLPDFLQEIRRERIVELFSEGHRFDDLMRWKGEKLIVGKRPKGAYYTAELKAVNATLRADANGYLDPYATLLKGAASTWGFDPAKNYLRPIPTTELTLNKNLKQNPGW